ncbi:hypothetical protein FA13DRAFT_1828178 [Coprinellus micaceus]|uniref:Uncharacterized protein n=1 Tax=Coprinellus micaceus TaxID=71717 RepID=A0A4Y7TIQ4_COPMI|nr:hypothetical protein FA13DRAFT_1828178 [Coprinellus micaceus]
MISCNLRTLGLTRTRLTLFIPTLILCYLIFSSTPESDPAGARPDEFELDINGDSVPLSNSHQNQNPRFCQGNECMRGKWVPREPPFRTLQDFQEVYASKGSSKWDKCPVGDLPLAAFTKDPLDEDIKADSLSADEKKRLEEQRIVDVFNWVWQPEAGRLQVEWDAMDFVVRLLKRPGGIVFMGDSVSQGHEHAFGSYLQEAGISFQMFSPPASYWAPSSADPGKDNGYPTIRSQILTPGHPVTLELQKRAGVPDSRMKRPVFSIVEEHLLVHEDELRRLVAPYGARADWPWHLQTMKRAERWVDFLAHLSDPYTGFSNAGREPGRKDIEEGVEWDTILVLNTGAHWSRGTMYMLPELGNVEEERKMLGGLFRDLVKSVTTKLTKPNLARLTIFYRSTSPAHPSCQLFTRPYPSLSLALSDSENPRWLDLMDAPAKDANERKVRRRWDWDLFDVHNKVWEEHIRALERERVGEMRRERAERAREEAVESLVSDAKARGRLRRPGDGKAVAEDAWREVERGPRGRGKGAKGVVYREYRRSERSESPTTEAEHAPKERRAPSRSRGRTGPKWHYVDFYEMALQRPDAHNVPGRDCLHWCLPVVYNEWTRHIYHLLWTEMEGMDGR